MLNSWSQYQISHWPEARWAKCSRATAAQGVTPVCWHASMMCWNRKCMVQQHTNAWYGYLMRAEWVRAASLKTDLAWDTSAQTKLARSSLTATASFSLPPARGAVRQSLINNYHEFVVQIHWKCTRFSNYYFWPHVVCTSLTEQLLLLHIQSLTCTTECICQSTKLQLKK